MKNYSVFSSDTYKKFYRSITSDHKLFDVLKSMPNDYGVVVEDPEALAKKFMDATVNYEYVRDCTLDGNQMKAIEDLIETCGSNSPFTRSEILHRIDFGLGLYDDSEKIESLSNGAKRKELFEQYMKTEGAKEISEQDLMESIKEKLSHNCLSSNDLRDYRRNMEESSDPLASSAALGEKGYRYRCIYSMDLYLRSENMSVEEAVCIGSADADIQAMASAVRHGEVCDKYAVKFINFIIENVRIFLFIFAVILAVLTVGVAVSGEVALAGILILASVALLSGGMYVLLGLISKKVNSKIIGAYFAKSRYTSYNREDVLEGLDIIADSIDEESEEVNESQELSAENNVLIHNPLNITI